MIRTLRTLAVASATAMALVTGMVTTTPAGAASPPPAGDAVRVATYNVMKTSKAGGKQSWAKRRVALVNTVRDAAPDVLLVQEVNTQKWRGVRHVDDVVALLGGIGYRITSTDYDSCTVGCTRGAHIFYNPDRMRLANVPMAAGMTGISTISQTAFGPVQDRNASWAFLTPVGSGRTSLYITVHLPTEKTEFSESLRVAVASHLRPWADSLIAQSGLGTAEIVIGGDFNSYAKRQPFGAQAVVTNAGLIDAYVAAVNVNPNFGTINYTPKTKKYKGFPPRPYFYKRDTTRIDYVFSTVAAQRHEVVLHLQSNGKFDNAYRASDHNMVMVDLPLR